MATISNTPRPGYVWDSTDNVWYPIGVGAHQHTNAADTPAVMPYSTYAAAGKNKIINGDFSVNQRAFTTTTADGTYGFDRWFSNNVDGTVTYSAQTFTAGDDFPEATVEGTNFARLVSTGQTLTTAEARISQRIEDVRTLADKTITISFWAKASTGTPNVAVNVSQTFGSGGSSAVVVAGQKFAITSSWVRYSKTFTVPSISGKTIGTNSLLRLNLWTSAGSTRNTDTDSLGIQSVTIDFWGVQVEAGSTVTAFQTATGNPASELAACQRYYYQWSAANAYSPFGVGFTQGTTLAILYKAMPVVMRTTPTITTTGTAANYAVMNGNTGRIACSAVPVINQGNPDGLILDWASTGLTAGGAIEGNANNTTAAYVGFSAEL